MLLRLHPIRDERAAIVFDDLASALDAGLGPGQLGGDTGQGERVLLDLARQRGVRLDPADEHALEAAWQAGRGGAALRRLAEARRRRANFARTFLRAISYPALLVTVATLVSFVVAAFGTMWLPVLTLSLSVALVVGTVVLSRGLEHGGPAWLGLPLVGELGRDLGELPYLEVLHALYASGVGLRDAHGRACRACPIAAVRERLLQADTQVQSGRSLGEALAVASPVHAETLSILTNGERAGDLEDALLRAIRRRRDTAARRVMTLSGLIRVLAYAFGAAVVLVLVVTFYSGYAAAIRGLR